MFTPKTKKGGDYPPNPKQWPIERNGITFRSHHGISPSDPLKPLELVLRLPGVRLLRRADLIESFTADAIQTLYEARKDVWSAFTLNLNGSGHLIVFNDTHPVTRQHATLMEEIFHIQLKHKPSEIDVCPVTGLMKRKYNAAVETEAYGSAAAALAPYSVLRALLEAGKEVSEIADQFEVSQDLIRFRLRVTRLVRKKLSA